MSLEQNVPVKARKFRLLAGSLIAVFIFAAGGVGGYWVGSRQQQSSPTTLQVSPKPSWVLSTTPVQQRSVTQNRHPRATTSVKSVCKAVIAISMRRYSWWAFTEFTLFWTIQGAFDHAYQAIFGPYGGFIETKWDDICSTWDMFFGPKLSWENLTNLYR